MTGHRASQIVDRIAEVIGARVGPSGVNVFTHRRLSLSAEQGELPAHSVDFGPDEPEVENTTYIDSTLTVPVTFIATVAVEDELRRRMLEQRREVHIALMADPTLGLPFVITTRYGGAEAPEFSANDEGELLAASLTSIWLVTYRMNLTDPGDD